MKRFVRAAVRVLPGAILATVGLVALTRVVGNAEEPAAAESGLTTHLATPVLSARRVVDELVEPVGEQRLADALQPLAASLGDSLRLGARVREVALDGAGVRIRYERDDGSTEIKARAAVIAIPSPWIPGLVRDLPSDTAEALSRVTFGSFVVMSILTGETEPMPWDDLYSILTPDFSAAFASDSTSPGPPPEASTVRPPQNVNRPSTLNA